MNLTTDEKNQILYLLACDLTRAKRLIKDAVLYKTSEFTRLAYHDDRQRMMPPGRTYLMPPQYWCMPDFKIRWQQAYAAKELFEKFAAEWPELVS